MTNLFCGAEDVFREKETWRIILTIACNYTKKKRLRLALYVEGLDVQEHDMEENEETFWVTRPYCTWENSKDVT